MKLKVSNALQSVDFSNDILQILPDEMLTEYIDICKQRLPHAMVGHHFLLMQNRTKSFLKQPENHRLSEIISAKCKFLIFVPRNANKTNCTFFGVTEEALKHKPDVCNTNLIFFFFTSLKNDIFLTNNFSLV